MSLCKITGLAPLILLLSLIAGAVSAEGSGGVYVEKSPLHRDVFDVPILVVLPEGCSFSKTRSGCIDRVKKISFEASVLRLPFPALLSEFNERNLGEADMELKMKKEFVLNGSPVVLMKIFQRKGQGTIGKWSLIVDRGEECWMLNGLYPAKDPKRSAAVLNTMKSAYWEDGAGSLPSLSPPAGRINEGRVQFRLAGLRDGAVVYTKDGLLPTRSEDGVLFVLSRLSNVLVTPDKRAAFARERFGMIDDGKSIDIVSEREMMIDNLPGYEIHGSAASDGNKLVYQTMLFDGTNSHVMVGIAGSDTAENLDLFQKTAETFRMVR